MISSMRHLRNINHGRRSQIDKSESRDQHTLIGILRRIVGCNSLLNVPIIVGHDHTIGQQATQQALIRMAVRIDKTWNQNAVCAIDNKRLGTDRKRWRNRPDLSILDKHVRFCKITNIWINRQNNGVPDQIASRFLQFFYVKKSWCSFRRRGGYTCRTCQK